MSHHSTTRKNSPSLPLLRIVAYTCMCLYVCICACMCACMCVFMCAYVRACVFVCVSMAAVHVCVHVCLLCLLNASCLLLFLWLREEECLLRAPLAPPTR